MQYTKKHEINRAVPPSQTLAPEPHRYEMPQSALSNSSESNVSNSEIIISQPRRYGMSEYLYLPFIGSQGSQIHRSQGSQSQIDHALVSQSRLPSIFKPSPLNRIRSIPSITITNSNAAPFNMHEKTEKIKHKAPIY